MENDLQLYSELANVANKKKHEQRIAVFMEMLENEDLCVFKRSESNEADLDARYGSMDNYQEIPPEQLTKWLLGGKEDL